MIVNFLQFVEWPPDARPAEGAPIVVAVVGAGNPLGRALEQIVANKTIAGHAVKVLYLNAGASAEGCHLLFVPREQDNDFSRMSQRISGQPILTVGETDAFTRAGGIIRFYTEDNKVRFQINPEAAEKVNLKISSKLLKLAKIVR
jgi:preprotein translocase subunit Sec61beta